VHIAVGYARQQDRLQTFAVTASVGPGASNMLTGAALATINRLPVLLLPSDIFATRVSSPVLQELEQPYGYDISVNDAFRPVSRFFDRVWRTEQLPAASGPPGHRCGPTARWLLLITGYYVTTNQAIAGPVPAATRRNRSPTTTRPRDRWSNPGSSARVVRVHRSGAFRAIPFRRPISGTSRRSRPRETTAASDQTELHEGADGLAGESASGGDEERTADEDGDPADEEHGLHACGVEQHSAEGGAQGDGELEGRDE